MNWLDKRPLEIRLVMVNEPETKPRRGVSLREFARILEERRRQNPEAAKLRDRLTDMIVENSLLRAMQHDGWLTQSQAAELLGVHRGTINRAVRAGKLITNGQSGTACRIHAESLFEHSIAREGKQLARLAAEAA